MFASSRRGHINAPLRFIHAFLSLAKTGKLTARDVVTWGVRGPSQDIYDDGTERESVYFFGIIDILQAWNTKKVCFKESGEDGLPSMRTAHHSDPRARSALSPGGGIFHQVQIARQRSARHLRGKRRPVRHAIYGLRRNTTGGMTVRCSQYSLQNNYFSVTLTRVF